MSNLNVIPEYELRENGVAADFVLKSMQEVWERNGGKQDVPHRHNYYTVLFVKRGEGVHYIDFEKYTITDMTLFFVSPDQVHQVLAESSSEGYVLLFTREFLLKHMIPESLITNIGLFSSIYNIPPIVMCAESLVRLTQFMESMMQAYKADDLFSKEAISAWLKLFFIETNKYASHLPDELLKVNPKSKDIVKDFKLLLEQNYRQWHKVSDYADKLMVSPDYLNSLIKESVGKTAKEFIQNRIILEAKRLGVHTSLSSKAISYEIGFDDPAHFSKFFKTLTNTSFSDFRMEIAAS